MNLISIIHYTNHLIIRFKIEKQWLLSMQITSTINKQYQILKQSSMKITLGKLIKEETRCMCLYIITCLKFHHKKDTDTQWESLISSCRWILLYLRIIKDRTLSVIQKEKEEK